MLRRSLQYSDREGVGAQRRVTLSRARQSGVHVTLSRSTGATDYCRSRRPHEPRGLHAETMEILMNRTTKLPHRNRRRHWPQPPPFLLCRGQGPTEDWAAKLSGNPAISDSAPAETGVVGMSAEDLAGYSDTPQVVDGDDEVPDDFIRNRRRFVIREIGAASTPTGTPIPPRCPRWWISSSAAPASTRRRFSRASP